MSLFQPTCAGLQDFEIHAVHDFFLFVPSPPDSVSAASFDSVFCTAASPAAASPTSGAVAPSASPPTCAPKRLKNSPASLRAAPSTSREPIWASLPPTCAVAVYVSFVAASPSGSSVTRVLPLPKPAAPP